MGPFIGVHVGRHAACDLMKLLGVVVLYHLSRCITPVKPVEGVSVLEELVTLL